MYITMLTLFEMALRCPLLKWLKYYSVDGIEQASEERTASIVQYCIEIINESDITPIRDLYLKEIKDANVTTNLQNIAKSESIKIIEKIEIDEIKLTVYKGEYNSKPALFSISTSKNPSPTHAYGLAIAKYIVDPYASDFVLCIIQPFNENSIIRILPENGVITKKGEIDKRSSMNLPWKELRDKGMKIIEDFKEFIKNTDKAVPDPIFGDCLFCPYHNVSLMVNGKKLQCRGGIV